MGEHGESNQIEFQLQKLGVPTPIPVYGNARVLVNPIDIFRCYLTEVVAGLLQGVDSQIIYDSIQYTNSLNHGDLVVVVPRLRLKGAKPADVLTDLCLQVTTLQISIRSARLTRMPVSRSSFVQSTHCLRDPSSGILCPRSFAPDPPTLLTRPGGIIWS